MSYVDCARGTGTLIYRARDLEGAAKLVEQRSGVLEGRLGALLRALALRVRLLLAVVLDIGRRRLGNN